MTDAQVKELTGLLQSNNVPAGVISWMTDASKGNIRSVKAFASYVEKRTELEADLLAKVTGFEKDKSALANLKQCWR